jgi:hypothetical protein
MPAPHKINPKTLLPLEPKIVYRRLFLNLFKVEYIFDEEFIEKYLNSQPSQQLFFNKTFGEGFIWSNSVGVSLLKYVKSTTYVNGDFSFYQSAYFTSVSYDAGTFDVIPFKADDYIQLRYAPSSSQKSTVSFTLFMWLKNPKSLDYFKILLYPYPQLKNQSVKEWTDNQLRGK